jgi:SAM-dependent methyltransferase
VITPRLVEVAECPDCRARLVQVGASVGCSSCSRTFEGNHGYLDLRPRDTFAEQTKYLEHELHADARHESIAPPVLGSKIRNDMLRRFLRPGPGDRIVDLGCGNGRAIVWNAASNAAILGVDISPFFAKEAVDRADLILGDLRRLPLRSGVFNKAWSLDVLEHVSPQAFREVLSEAHRVLEPGGALFIYTHVRTNGWPAAGVRAVNRVARVCERMGLIDLQQERLRKSDHLNPVGNHDELARIVADCGFRIERITYYSPIVGALMENVVARIVERAMARRAARVLEASGSADPAAPVKAARRAAQARVRRGGATYWALRAATAAMAVDLLLFGRVRSGPYFALLRRGD